MKVVLSVLCVFVIVRSGLGGNESLADLMARTSQLCCNQGSTFARNHSSGECSSSLPPDIPVRASALCIFTMDQCCNDYYEKKKDCDSGITLATTSQNCAASSSAVALTSCCEKCLEGGEAGRSRGEGWCSQRDSGHNAEEMLAVDAFNFCCTKAAKGNAAVPSKPRKPEHNPEPVTLSRTSETVASLCEEYAPNELCAHHCIPVPGSFKCECNPGFTLMPDKKNCKEITRNRCKPRNPCQHKCIDDGENVKCYCRRGYQLMSDGKSCEDTDECMLSTPVCMSGTECHNVQGSYRCIPTKKHENKMESTVCPPGYSKNEVNGACDDINECDLPHPPCSRYLCENTIGGYRCGGVSGDPVNLSPKTLGSRGQSAEDRCPTGFKTGSNEECEDVDECAMGTDDCNRQSQFCINKRGSFHCQDRGSRHCPPGFKINEKTGKCEDINECEDGQDICKINQMCVNVLGEYDCRPVDEAASRMRTCPDGMRLIPGTGTCQDINECVEGTHMCDQYQKCLNTNGSHECHCRVGFQLDPTTGACVDINECATNQHTCIPKSQRCDNTVGSYLCIRFVSCGTGYILHHSKSTCEDIDECALKMDNCAHAGKNFHCENIPGSFRCIRKVTTTSTTTAAPEYEYEYYDTDDEEEPNKGNETVSTTTISPSEPGQEVTPQTVFSSTSELPSSSQSPEEPEEPSPKPEQIQPEYTQPDSEQPQEYPQRPASPQKPSPEYPRSELPVEPRLTRPLPTDYDTSPNSYPRVDPRFIAPPTQPEPKKSEEPTKVVSSTYYYEPKESSPGTPTTKEEDEESNTIDVDTSSENPSTPKIKNVGTVYVSPNQETAVVTGKKEPDGSVVVDTGDVPKSIWTKIKPNPCNEGFELDDYGACLDIDECATSQHSCSGLTEVCRNTMGGYLCDCAPLFRRDQYSGACVLVTSSSSSTSTSTSTSTTTSTSTVTPTTEVPPTPVPSPSTPNRVNNLPARPNKTQTFWGYPEYSPRNVRPFKPRSMCDIGYIYNTRTGKCDDIDECTNGQANCAAEEICVNTINGYTCVCQPNWKLDEVRHRCVPPRRQGVLPPGYENIPVYKPPEKDTEEDQNNMIVTPQVPAGNGPSVATCPNGYRRTDDGNCEDIDECLSGEAFCGTMLCINLAGGYTCACPPGHERVDEHDCRDVDECAQAGGVPLCSPNADCVNTVGSFQCRCHQGFRAAPVNDKVCVDVNECESSGPNLCQHKCNNHWGGYRCSCHRGYRLNADNSTCSDIDECTEYKNNIVCVGRCVNEPGSYRCTCPSGYRLSEDRKSCIDINECETGEAPCASTGEYNGTSDVCLNTRGGFRCFRITCPYGYRLESRHRCTKVDRVCRPSDYECAHQPTTYSYNYITFVSKLYIPASKVDLFTMRGPAWPHARMKFQLRLIQATTPPHVRKKADINSFLLVQTNNQAVMSLVESLEGPQSIELELSMDLYSGEQFGGTAVAKLFIYVSEYEF